MSRMIFVNLPVADLPRAQAFYEAIGFTNEPRFTDETAACMVISDTIFTMLLTHEKWKTFTTRPICPSGSSEVSLALSCNSKEEVNRFIEAAGANGGIADVNLPEDHGFMLQRSFADLDGHVWEPLWMDPAVAHGEAHVSKAEASA
jgi:hypothetical protein